ncbi:MAG: hypothetical protein KGZ88_10005 [Methylomicrobium sp.]|nr:hypothetical protein [Methylomicrobium sp.]
MTNYNVLMAGGPVSIDKGCIPATGTYPQGFRQSFFIIKLGMAKTEAIEAGDSNEGGTRSKS